MRRGLLVGILVASFCFSPAVLAAQPVETHDLGQGSRPRIASDNHDHLHVVYEATADGAKMPDIFYSESSDNGVTWTAPVDVSKTPGVSSQADIAVEKDGAIDVVWSDTSAGERYPDVFFARSTDNGKSFTPPLDIATTPGRSTAPKIAVGSDNLLHVVWCDTSTGEKNQDIYYSYSADSGKKWGKDVLLPAQDISNTAGASAEPSLAVDAEDNVHVVWSDTSSGKERPDIFYTCKRGNDWAKAVDLSNTTGVSSHPDIACGKGKIFVAWSEAKIIGKAGGPWIWSIVGNKDGEFGKVITLSSSPGVSVEPSIGADMAGRVAAAWVRTTSGASKPDVHARISVDNLDDVSRVFDFSQQQGNAKHPDVAVCGGKMFAVWELVQSGKSLLKVSSVNMGDVATGPSKEAGDLHTVTGNQH